MTTSRGQRGRGMGGHSLPNEGKTDVWLTPPDLLKRLGRFDLDPCACADPRPWPTADHMIAPPHDGLAVDWSGRVWLNPPYGTMTGAWLERLANHGSGMALIFARTETEDWRRFVWGKATGILFLSGRLFFHRPDGSRAEHNSGAPSALVAYSQDDADLLKYKLSDLGVAVDGWSFKCRGAA